MSVGDLLQEASSFTTNSNHPNNTAPDNDTNNELMNRLLRMILPHHYWTKLTSKYDDKDDRQPIVIIDDLDMVLTMTDGENGVTIEDQTSIAIQQMDLFSSVAFKI